jgi:choline dehydrogenase-like flavoprotein
VSNFNAVGGSTILYAAHFPALHPSDFRVRTLDGVADDWPIDYATLEPWYDVNAHMMGVSGLAGDPAYPPKAVPLPPGHARQARRDARARLQRARLALVAVGQRDHHRRARGPRAVHQRGHVSPRLRAGREGVDRHHILAPAIRKA